MADNDRSRDNSHLDTERRPWLAIGLLLALAVVAIILAVLAF
jgi:hypothetical protein